MAHGSASARLLLQLLIHPQPPMSSLRPSPPAASAQHLSSRCHRHLGEHRGICGNAVFQGENVERLWRGCSGKREWEHVLFQVTFSRERLMMKDS